MSVRDKVYDAGMRALRMLEAADAMVDDAERERLLTYSETRDGEQREHMRAWLDRLQSLRDALVEHSHDLVALHGSISHEAS